MNQNKEIYFGLQKRLLNILKTRNPQIKKSRLQRLMDDVLEIYDLPNSRNSIGIEFYNDVKEYLMEMREEAV